MVEPEEFELIQDILNDKHKQNSRRAESNQPILGSETAFEESLVNELVTFGGFSRVVAEKILSKEGSLEKKTLEFTKILGLINQGHIDVAELEEQRQAQLAA